MKAIELKNLTDAQWISYLRLLNSVRKKYNEDNYSEYDGWEEYMKDFVFEEVDWKKFKIIKLDIIESGKNELLNEYAVIQGNDDVIAWFAQKDIGDSIDFIYDFLREESSEIIIIILKKVYEFMIERERNVVTYATGKLRKSNQFKKTGAEIYFEAEISKLSKEDMNIKYWKDIVATNKFVDNFKLEFQNDVPMNIISEDMRGRFVDLMNEYIADKEIYNPSGHVPGKITIEHLIDRIESSKDDKNINYTYILFDKNEIAAFYTVYFLRNGKTIIGGGTTYVTRNYRGKNLGRYLKARMYLKAIEDFPSLDYILSNTFTWNKYMHRINEEMGFKPFETELKFRFTKEFLENYLKIIS